MDSFSDGVAVTILSGFLGSGKTTILNALLSQNHGMKVAVIVNEFGEIGVDGQWIQGAEKFVELDNGCLCCALNEDLEKTVRELKERGGFDHLVLETTGVADPLPVAWTFTRPGLSEYYRMDAIVTVIDALNFPQCSQESMEARLQAERADLLLINKIDLVQDTGEQAHKCLDKLNQSASRISMENGNIAWEILLGRRSKNQHVWSTQELKHHHVSFETLSCHVEGEIDEVALEEFIESLPTSIYRVKGIVLTDAEWGWTSVNAVAGRIELRPMSSVPAQACLVFIGHDLDKEKISKTCAKLSSNNN
jgi:G3E family GTPase